MLGQERGWPRRVRAAEQRVRVPRVEVERLWRRDGRVREHGREYGEHFRENLVLRQSFDAAGEGALRSGVGGVVEEDERKAYGDGAEKDARPGEEVRVVEGLPYGIAATFLISIKSSLYTARQALVKYCKA
jgi:hypothetical protein